MKQQNSSGIFKITECRICSSRNLYTFLNLGKMPIPNGFLSKKDLTKPEEKYPLKVCVCESCWFVQLTHVVSPEIMFKNYLYIPSTSTRMQKHFASFAESVVASFATEKKPLIIDIGSNDGLLLNYFKKLKCRVLGIDPASNLALEANKNGIETIDAFFSPQLARDIVEKYGQARVVTATNVIAHIHNLDEVFEGVATLIGKTGVFIMEAPYFIDLLDRNEFDTIYHEHLSYFSIAPLMKLLARHGLRVIDVQKQSVHGGTVRISIAHVESTFSERPGVEKTLVEERLKKLNRRSTYDEFARRVSVMKRDMLAFFKRIKKNNKRIVGYGAAAKGNVFLNYCGITTDTLDYVVDSISYKQGKYTPGTHIPIYPETKLLEDSPDYALILSWNFADEIIEKNREFRERGGQFIVATPYLRII